MAVRHLVFAECAEACADDPCLQDTFIGLAYGQLPMCVFYDEGADTLIFRRSLTAAEKDKAHRLALAAEELQGNAHVAAYNAQQREPLHVNAVNLSVAWAVAAHNADTHQSIVPALLQWTRWERDAPWQALRVLMAREAKRPLPSLPLRHVRLAQILEWVGSRARAAGGTGAEVHAACTRAAQQFAAGQLVVTCDPETNDLASVEELPSNNA